MTPATASAPRRRPFDGLKTAAAYLALAAAALFAVFPIVWAVLTSLKTDAAISAFPPSALPNPPTFEHYGAVLPPVLRQMVNSGFVTLATIVATLAIGVHAAYAAARRDFPLKKTILFVILCSMMIPGIAVLVPLYMLAAQLGLIDTYFVLVLVYTAWMTPMATWLLKGFFETVPRDLEDAALMDGCSRLGVLYRVALPLVLPGISAVAIVVFIYVWNEFIIALSLTTSEDRRLVTVGVYYYITAYGIDWGKLLAAVSLAMAPVVASFLLLQRGFIHGLTAGATRG